MYHNNVMQCSRGVISIEKICKTVMHEIIKEDLGIIDVLIATCIMKDSLNLLIVSEDKYLLNFVLAKVLVLCSFTVFIQLFLHSN